MELVTTETGPGGTELLARADRLSRKEAPKGATIPLGPGHTAWRLQQAVEFAQREGVREQLESALHHRQQFWMDTCREALEMRTASRQVLELHRENGCRFCVPAPRQVQYILDALDSALPHWERRHPELFYRTLELNFPELVRLCRARPRG